MNHPNSPWPRVDREQRHIRTADGWTVIPFSVISALACVAVVVVGIEATFGLTNWITIPTVIAAAIWAVERCDHASTIHRFEQNQPDHEDQP
jgi:Flp pilus assembly protein TadB